MAQLLAVEADKFIGKRIQQKRKKMGYSVEKLSEYNNYHVMREVLVRLMLLISLILLFS